MISIIIPTLNEAPSIGLLLQTLCGELEPHEIIVSDGGSTDATREIAESWNCTIVSAPLGRGQQLCAGVALAQGDVFLFLHADTRFPTGGLAAINQTLQNAPDAPGGNFRLLFDGSTTFDEWLNRFYAWIRRRGFYYGDSGIFVRRSAYEAIGRFRPIALMEDYDFVRRLERSGPTLCIDEPPLISSSRRFLGRKGWSIITGWILIHTLYYLRVPPGILARLYNSRRASQQSHRVERRLV